MAENEHSYSKRQKMETKKKKKKRIRLHEDCYLEGKAILREMHRIQSCVEGLQHPQGMILPLQSTGALRQYDFICGLSFPWQYAKFLASLTRLHLAFQFYAVQALTEGSSYSVTNGLPGLPRFPLKSGCILTDLILWHFSTQEKSTPCIQSLSDWGLQDKNHIGL